MSAPTIGCIADDYTGGTDVAAAFRRQGLRTVLLFGAPDDVTRLDDCDAVVVALKTRALEAGAAAKIFLAARNWLVTDTGVAVRPVADHEAERLSGLHR